MEPTKPGVQTSEFKLTVLVMAVGFALDVAGVILEAVQKAGVAQDNRWLPVALVIAGTGLMLVKALGYTRSRTMLKLAAAQQEGVDAIKASVPFVAKVAEAVRESYQKQPLPPGEPKSLESILSKK